MSMLLRSSPLLRIPICKPSLQLRNGAPKCQRLAFGSTSYHPERDLRINKTLLWSTIGLSTLVWLSWTSAVSPQGGQGSTKATTALRRTMERNFILNSNDLKNGKYQTLLTSVVSHINPFHLIFNMMSLHAVASPILGLPSNLFASLMLGTALSGSLGFIAHSRSRGYTNQNGLGASGMVAGIGVATSMLVPRASVLLFAVVPMPLWVATAGYVLFDLYYLDDPSSRVGHSGHLGGAAFGAAFYMVFLRKFGGVFPRF